MHFNVLAQVYGDHHIPMEVYHAKGLRQDGRRPAAEKSGPEAAARSEKGEAIRSCLVAENSSTTRRFAGMAAGAASLIESWRINRIMSHGARRGQERRW